MGRVDAQPSAGLEAERAVLGALLIDESIVSQVLAEVDERDFTSTSNRLIFQAAREVFREGGHADAITINAKLGYASGSPQQQQLIDLMKVTPTSASWREYAQLMREQAALGRIRASRRRSTARLRLTTSVRCSRAASADDLAARREGGADAGAFAGFLRPPRERRSRGLCGLRAGRA
ncbi:MAG: DnaB-like helicase N-terminal domain-containing protein [Oscillospiraceae bacterium]